MPVPFDDGIDPELLRIALVQLEMQEQILQLQVQSAHLANLIEDLTFEGQTLAEMDGEFPGR